MVDILLSTYNGEKYLEEQLDSLINQSYKNIHIIVRDDASDDSTPIILLSYQNKYPSLFEIHLERSNFGPKKSFFELCRLSKSEYIMFCDQDDVWFKTKIEDSLRFLIQTEGIDKKPSLIYTDVIPTNETLEPISDTLHTRLNSGTHNTLNKSLFSSKATGMATIFNRSLLQLMILPDDERIMMHDMWFDLCSTIIGTKRYLNNKTAFYRQHKNNTAGYRPLNFISYYIGGTKRAKWYLNYTRECASCALDAYDNMISKQQKDIISYYINLNKYNIIKKYKLIKKYGYSDNVFSHYLALLFF